MVFLGTSLLSAWSLDRVADDPSVMIKAQVLLASLLSLLAVFVFATIRVNETAAPNDDA